MGTIRAFIAISLPEPIRQTLSNVQQQLRGRPGGTAGRWVHTESIHLTLKFLGDVEESSLPAISARMRRACANVSPFDIAIEGTGCYPNTRRPRVVWAGVRKPHEALSNLQARVDAQMETLGHAPERRSYSPHLTLARVSADARSHDAAALGRSVADDPTGVIGILQVEDITLFRSELRPQGAIYTPMVRIALR